MLLQVGSFQSLLFVQMRSCKIFTFSGITDEQGRKAQVRDQVARHVDQFELLNICKHHFFNHFDFVFVQQDCLQSIGESNFRDLLG